MTLALLSLFFLFYLGFSFCLFYGLLFSPLVLGTLRFPDLGLVSAMNPYWYAPLAHLSLIMVLLFQCPTDSEPYIQLAGHVFSGCSKPLKINIFKIELFFILWTVVLLSLHSLFKVALPSTQLSKLGNPEPIILSFYFLSLIQSLKKSFLSSIFFFSSPWPPQLTLKLWLPSV